jgi:hypothetical protein
MPYALDSLGWNASRSGKGRIGSGFEMKTCVVIAACENTRDLMAASLEARGLDAALLASLGELRGTLEKVPACGILLELAAAITASMQVKKNTRELLELYPCAKFRLAGNEALDPGDTLDSFAQKCLAFEPRKIPASVRESRFLAVYLSADDTFTDAEKVVTADVSARGCFLYSARQWTPGSRVWLKFPGVEAVFCGTCAQRGPGATTSCCPALVSGSTPVSLKSGDALVPNLKAAEGRRVPASDGARPPLNPGSFYVWGNVM